MKLFDYAYYNDYGAEHHIQILRLHRLFALSDIVIQWDDYPAPEFFPMLIMSIGNRSVCGFTFRWKAFEIKCDMITTVPRNLEFYKRKRDD